MKFFRKNKGITLVALIVTIIVLLILAGVSLKLVAGGNGIIGKAVTAREEHTKAREKETLQIAYTSAMMSSELFREPITGDKLLEELEQSGIKAGVIEDEDGTIRV